MAVRFPALICFLLIIAGSFGCRTSEAPREQPVAVSTLPPVRTWQNGNAIFIQDTVPEQLATIRIVFPGGTSVLPPKDQWAAAALFRHWLDFNTGQEFQTYGIRSRWHCGTAYAFAEFHFSVRQIPESLSRIQKWLYQPTYHIPQPVNKTPGTPNAISEVMREARGRFLLPSVVPPENQPLHLDSLSWYGFHRIHVIENNFYICSSGITDDNQLNILNPVVQVEKTSVSYRTPGKGGIRGYENEYQYLISSDTGTAISVLIPGPGRSYYDHVLYQTGLNYLNSMVRTSWNLRFPGQEAPVFICEPHPDSYGWTTFRTQDPVVSLSIIRSALHNMYFAKWDTALVGGLIRDQQFVAMYAEQESQVRLDQYTEQLLMHTNSAAIFNTFPLPTPVSAAKYWNNLPACWKVTGCGSCTTVPDSVILRPFR